MIALSSNNEWYLLGQLIGLPITILGVWGWFATPRRYWAVYLAAAVFIFADVMVWITMFGVTTRTASSSYANLFPIVNAAAAIVVVCAMRFHPILTSLLLAYTFSLLLQAFTVLYWNFGGGANFSHHLSHLDALYFAVGTLTTAGTGNIAAISETARRIVTAQMILDVALMVFAVTVVITKGAAFFAARRSVSTSNI